MATVVPSGEVSIKPELQRDQAVAWPQIVARTRTATLPRLEIIPRDVQDAPAETDYAIGQPDDLIALAIRPDDSEFRQACRAEGPGRVGGLL